MKGPRQSQGLAGLKLYGQVRVDKGWRYIGTENRHLVRFRSLAVR